ncbi:MAG: ComF family protein [Gammaproteobacteria bacterium]|nr:ComF family protein [Gammaproteobacteria bacterium]
MLKRIVQAIYPATCILCGDPGQGRRDLCHACEQDFTENQSACRICAIPLPETVADQVCGQCLQKKPPNNTAWSPFVYAQPLEWIIQQLKFNKRLSYARLLSDLMIERLASQQVQADCIIPVPLHNKRLLSRGFNQSVEIIRPVARYLDISLDTRSCQRQGFSAPQSAMDAKQRRKNIKGVFKFNNQKNYKHVIVFDDIVTTGSTAGEIVKVIKRQGVKQVDVWSLARADKIYK